MSRIYEIFGTNAHAMTRALMESAGAACKIPSGASVALKPNLVVAASPETGATTHAGVLSGAIEYLRDHGFRDISIIEGSWVGDDTRHAALSLHGHGERREAAFPLSPGGGEEVRRAPLRPQAGQDPPGGHPPAAHGHLLPRPGRGLPHQPARAQGPLPDRHDLRPKKLQGLPARPGEAALPLRGADAPHRRPGRRPAAGADHRGQPLRGSGF